MKEFVLSAPEAPQLNIDYAAELSPEQYAVVAEGDGPCLVLAGAGSGKTRTVTYRVAWLLEHGVSPDQILLLTFTNKAAKEMMTRLELLLKTFPQGVWAGTFHSIANRILRMYGKRTEFGNDFSILDEEDANDLMKLCIKEANVAQYGKRFPSSGVLRGIASYAANANLSIPDAIQHRNPSFSDFSNEITTVVAAFREGKRRGKAMDFDDMLIELRALLQNDPEVRQALAGRFRYVLVDEFQDTNIIQADIVDLLSSVHRNLLVVGDDAQSIYSFRAAEIRNILEFPERYPATKMFRLVTNYRSTPEILAVANAVIKGNKEQFPKELVAVVQSGEKPMVVPAADDRQEAQYVAEQILQLLNNGGRLPDIAVLFRAAFHSQALEFELLKRDIPYEIRGGLKFFERVHIKDAIAHLRILRNVKDNMAWIRALQIHPGFGLTTAAKVAAYASSQDSARAAIDGVPRLGSRAVVGWQRVVKIIGAMLATDGPSPALRAFAATESYKEYLEAEYQNARERLEDVEQFAVFAEQYDDIGQFLDAVTLTGDFGVRLTDPENNQQPEGGEERLILSTIHQAKGLEWNTVFIIHLAEGSFPHQRSYGSEAEMSEERRLFYVAATRAKKQLIFTYPITSGYETVEIRQPSTFLDEIPRDAVEQVKLRPSLPSWAQSSVAKETRYSHSWDDDEPTIVLDASGERTEPRKPAPPSFLRSVDDL